MASGPAQINQVRRKDEIRGQFDVLLRTRQLTKQTLDVSADNGTSSKGLKALFTKRRYCKLTKVKLRKSAKGKKHESQIHIFRARLKRL